MTAEHDANPNTESQRTLIASGFPNKPVILLIAPNSRDYI